MTRLLAIIAAVLASGCVQQGGGRANLQPLVAAAGYYGLMDAKVGPTPAPSPKGCVDGCKCGGTGKEKSGDGLAMVNCRCPDDCACKKKGAAKCQSGTCPPQTRSIVR